MRPIGQPGQHLRSLGQHPIHGQGHLCKGYPSPQTLPRPTGGPISTHLISRCEGVEIWMGLGSVAWSGQSGWTQSCGRTCKLANLNSFFLNNFWEIFFLIFFFTLFQNCQSQNGWTQSCGRTCNNFERKTNRINILLIVHHLLAIIFGGFLSIIFQILEHQRGGRHMCIHHVFPQIAYTLEVHTNNGCICSISPPHPDLNHLCTMHRATQGRLRHLGPIDHLGAITPLEITVKCVAM